MAKEVYVADRHTDFIFSVIAEEFGFIGASALISIFFLLIYHIIKIALETNSPFNSDICAGIISMITFQALSKYWHEHPIAPHYRDSPSLYKLRGKFDDGNDDGDGARV